MSPNPTLPPLATIGDAFPQTLVNLVPPTSSAAPQAPAPAPAQLPPTFAPNPGVQGPVSGGTPPPPLTRLPDGGDSGDSWKNGSVRFPRWLIAVLLLILGVYAGYQATYRYNWNQPFQLSDSLDHQGAWYRQVAVAPVDYFRSRRYDIRADFWGRKFAVYTVGERRFLQTRSGEPAVEIYSSK